MRALRELERQEDRVLGALRIVDAGTGAALERAVELRAVADGRVVLTRNRSGLHVIREWSALAAHAGAFAQPPAAPAIGSRKLRLAVRDPLGIYLPRIAAIALPRDADPANAAAEVSLYRPVEVPMYASASAPPGANWAVLRVTLSATGSGDALGGALLRVRRNGEVLARGLSDWRGEALVPVVGVPVTTFSDDDDAVVVSAIEVTLEAFFDPATGTRTPMAAVRAGRAPASLPLVDPVALEAQAGGLPSAAAVLSIAARRQQHRALGLALP